MSGHSKWAQIKHKKAAADAKRGNLFSKLGKAIAVAARAGADPGANPKLRLAIDRARSFNMPLDNIERAVAKAADSKEAGEMHSVAYEAYGPEGSAILIEGTTDNKNRTSAEIKHLLSERGGKLAEVGSVAWMFERKGVLFLAREKNPGLAKTEGELILIEAGAEDIEEDSDGVAVLTDPERKSTVAEELEKKGFVIERVSDAMVPKTSVSLSPSGRKALEKLVLELESHDDVETVWTNAEN